MVDVVQRTFPIYYIRSLIFFNPGFKGERFRELIKRMSENLKTVNNVMGVIVTLDALQCRENVVF